jgi:hypothetical protein
MSPPRQHKQTAVDADRYNRAPRIDSPPALGLQSDREDDNAQAHEGHQKIGQQDRSLSQFDLVHLVVQLFIFSIFIVVLLLIFPIFV